METKSKTMNVGQLLRGNAAILIGGGEIGAQIDMHNLVTIPLGA